MERLRSAIGVGSDHKRMNVDGVDLAYEDRGEGQAVVCLHATGHGAGDFAPLRERLGHRYRFVTLDWPGQGRSGDDLVPASAQRYAALLAGFLDALGIEAPIVLGNSIGGAAAIRFAAEHPTRPRALVLADPGGLIEVNAFARRFCNGMVRFFRAGASGARWFPAAFAAYYRLVLRAPSARAQRARIVAASREIAPVLVQAWESFGAPEADIRELAASVRCPVLFTWAKQDQIVSYARSKPGIACLPNHRIALLKGGHAAFLEDLDSFVVAFEDFVTSPPTAPAR
jgi:4,5:9,10-diseco-3-hydroxy-5,9,17-trioxoandrosta-1(10),2-diene-4-oate hydrolase